MKVQPKKETNPGIEAGKAPEITMLVRTQEQLEQALLIPELSAIYVDSTVGLGMKAYRLLKVMPGAEKRFFLCTSLYPAQGGDSFLEQNIAKHLRLL